MHVFDNLAKICTPIWRNFANCYVINNFMFLMITEQQSWLLNYYLQMKGTSVQCIMLYTFRTTTSSNYIRHTLPGNLSLTPLRHFSFIWIGWGVLFQSTFHRRPLLPPYCPSAKIKSPYMAYTEQNNYWFTLAEVGSLQLLHVRCLHPHSTKNSQNKGKVMDQCYMYVAQLYYMLHENSKY